MEIFVLFFRIIVTIMMISIAWKLREYLRSFFRETKLEVINLPGL